MGWLWSSSSPPRPSPQPSEQSLSSSSSSSSSPPPQSTTTDPVDPELQKFMELFNKPEPPSPSSSAPTSSSASPSFLSSFFSSLKTPEPAPTPPLSPLTESLLPTDMSCRQAFDLAWSCTSLGGQWNAVYRHGNMRSCSPLWDDFWFCMRTKSYSGTIKEEAVREHYRRKEYEKYYAPGAHSSEDIWEARQGKVPLGTAFAEGIEIPSVSDEEWRSMEEARRRKIREGLGFDKTS